ncbi:hypothetical protein G9A89_021903 [Geosiphon pyriformis]|nr:hypothetical protein G9A89_021903 [Geosiphon pyriformis]
MGFYVSVPLILHILRFFLLRSKGLQVLRGKTYAQKVQETFRISMAALDHKIQDPEGRTSLKVTYGGQDFILCTLTPRIQEQQILDLVFNEGEEIVFSIIGNNNIHLTGHYLVDEDVDSYYHSDEDSQDSYEIESLSDLSGSDNSLKLGKRVIRHFKKRPRSLSDNEEGKADSKSPIKISKKPIEEAKYEIETDKPKDLKSQKRKNQIPITSKSRKFDSGAEKAKFLTSSRKSSKKLIPNEKPVSGAGIDSNEESAIKQEEEDSDYEISGIRDFLDIEAEEDDNNEKSGSSEEDFDIPKKHDYTETFKRLQKGQKEFRAQDEIKQERPANKKQNLTTGQSVNQVTKEKGKKRENSTEQKDKDKNPQKKQKKTKTKYESDEVKQLVYPLSHVDETISKDPESKQVGFPAEKSENKNSSVIPSKNKKNSVSKQEKPTDDQPLSVDPAPKNSKEKPPKKDPTDPATKSSKVTKVTTASGLIIEDHKLGQFEQVAKSGKKILVRYIGRLPDGTVFDQNIKGTPFRFTLGRNEVIKGWDEGIAGMRVGGERKLHVPAKLAYGKKGAKPAIPPNTNLTFEIKLLAVN